MVHLRDVVMRLPSGSGPVTILDGVTLAVPVGQFLAVTGPSGSGKSTLLGLIAGLDRPTSGSIAVDGRELSSLDEDALARLRRDTIGYVFQSFHLIPTLTALENVAVPLELAGAADPAGQAATLLADEPTGNLDSATGAQIIDLLVAWNRKRRGTLVMVTHDPALACHADRVVELRDGRVASDRLNGSGPH